MSVCVCARDLRVGVEGASLYRKRVCVCVGPACRGGGRILVRMCVCVCVCVSERPRRQGGGRVLVQEVCVCLCVCEGPACRGGARVLVQEACVCLCVWDPRVRVEGTSLCRKHVCGNKRLHA